MFEKSKWIWSDSSEAKDARVIIRKTFNIDKIKKNTLLTVSVSDTYSLYVNGELTVLGGSLARTEDFGYYDSIDITRQLKKGENVLAFACVHYGYEGNGSKSCGAAGLIFACEELELYSDESCKYIVPEGYSVSEREHCFYTGSHYAYDASKSLNLSNVYDVEFNSNSLMPCVTYGEYGAEPYKECQARSIPMFLFKQIKVKYNKVIEGADAIYTAELGEAMHFVPVVSLSAFGTEKIVITSDRYVCEDASQKTFTNGRAEYICASGEQVVQPDIVLSGSQLILKAPIGVKITGISVIKSSYASEVVGGFNAYDKRIDTLYSKSINALSCCMRETLIDTPDRDRGIKLGTASRQAGAAIALFDEMALPLIKKTVQQIFADESPFLKNDPCSEYAQEVPSDALLALSEQGIVAKYFLATNDLLLMEQIFSKATEYLLLWQMEGNRLVLRGDKPYFADDGYNIDGEVLQTALYYSACKFFSKFDAFNAEVSLVLKERAETILNSFDENYFDGTGYASGSFYDDRANALAVLCGLVPEENKNKVLKVLKGVCCASLQTESYVLLAMTKIGGAKAALDRLYSRYAPIINDSNPTMPELFDGGALCHGGSVGILEMLLCGFAGICVTGADSVQIVPTKVFEELKFETMTHGGKISGLYRAYKDELMIDNATALKVSVMVKDKAVQLSKGKTKISY